MIESLAKLWDDAIRPPPLIGIEEWSERNITLSSANSARPGEYRTDVTPYVREPMARLSPSDEAVFVYLMWAAQTAKSTILNAFLGYYIGHDPSPCLMMQPTVQLAETYSKQRIAPMISGSPLLSSVVGDPKSRDGGNTLGLKEFPGGMLVMVGANAPTMMRSMPIRIVAMDEVDGYPLSAGSEGSPVKLVQARTSSFPNRKILLTSTPGTTGVSVIEAGFLSTGQRHYHVPCPHCGTMQRIEWERIEWDGDDHKTARMRCINDACTTPILDRHKATMLPAGEWIAEHPDREDGESYGYHLSGLYAPLGWTPVSWPNLVREFIEARGDPQADKAFVTIRLAETYDEFAATDFDEGGLMQRAETYAAPVPAGVACLTAGCDVQGDRIECEIVGWGIGEESWSIDYTVLPGDPSGDAVWEDLAAHLSRQWMHETAGPMGLTCAAIDCGYETTRVQAFTNLHRRRSWFAVKGLSGVGKPLWPKRGKRGKAGKGETYFAVGIDDAKAANWRRLQRLEPGPGCMHFPIDRDITWYEQLVSEVPRTTYVKNHPRKQWFRRSGSAKAEALDCRVYAYCVLYSYLRVGRSLEKIHAALPQVTPVQAARSMDAPKRQHVPPPKVAVKKQASKRPVRRSGFKARF